MVSVSLSVVALLVTLPSLPLAAGQNYNQQPRYELPFPHDDIQMHSQQVLELSGHQLVGQQVPYSQGLIASPHSAQEGAASMEATIVALQTQLTAERINEIQLANVAAQKQEEMRRVNESFAHILTLSEVGARQERELQEQLANATSKNEGLKAELRKAREKDLRDEGEVTRLRDEAREASHNVKQNEFLQKRAVHVMQDVQAAQEKVRRTEEIIRSLLPRLEPHLRVPVAGSHVAEGQDIEGGSSRGSDRHEA